jgi:hypothetical protein
MEKKEELNVTITNVYGGKGHICVKGSLGMTIDKYFEICRSLHPDSFVNFYWNDNKNFIFGQPLNMQKDEILVDEGKMLMCDFIAKWYPEIAGTEYSN